MLPGQYSYVDLYTTMQMAQTDDDRKMITEAAVKSSEVSIRGHSMLLRMAHPELTEEDFLM